MSASHHGAERLRKRNGIPKRRVFSEVRRVLELGRKVEDLPSPVRDYIEQQTYEHNTLVLVYGNTVYFFNDDSGGQKILGTCYPLPGRLTKYLRSD